LTVINVNGYILVSIDGFLNLHKPLDFTSHDCVAKLRRLLNTKKIGHAGTLDPAATGVLPIAVGRATRLLQYLPGDKAYRAIVRFGVTTATDDLAGEVLRSVDATHLGLDDVVALLPQFQGQIDQVPPSYSAIQVDGKRLYDLARSGQTVIAPTRSVMVSQIEVLGWRSDTLVEIDLAIDCGAGTYIRSIARDLGERVGTGATLAGLCRTFSSGFDLAASLTFAQIEAQLADGALAVALASPEAVLTQLPRIGLSGDAERRWRLGQKILIAGFDGVDEGRDRALAAGNLEQAYRVDGATGDFLGITHAVREAEGWRLPPQMVYRPA
jgi:tRNA pseudouridine55 synthase